MVNKSIQLSKSAFSMIELIFAIVIIGITVISLPMVNQIVSKGVEGNLVQEAIFASSAEINQILSYRWDENSIQNNDILSKVIWANSSDCDTSTKLRLGHVNAPLHRKCLDNNVTAITAAANLGLDTGESTTNDSDDIDDFNADAKSIFIDNSGGGTIVSSKGYKKDYNSSVSVSYVNFDPNFSANNNIKKVTVNISDTSGNIITRLSAFSANIGEVDYYKRNY